MAPLPLGAIAACTAVLVLGCNAKPKSLEERGAGVFLRACAGCHGPDGRGTKRPGYKVPPRNLTTPEAAALTDEHIFSVVRNGKGEMPPFGRMLPERDVRAVIAHVRTLHRESRPAQSASTTSAP